jgi:diadenosine tetraphosphate (Ap4A) HIT family hydrolase
VIADCAACQKSWPPSEARIAGFRLSDAYLHADQSFTGWTVLVLRRHATELFELTEGERAELIEEVSALARAVATAFDARKVNYALLGNQLPHIHWHIIPRGADDPDRGVPPWSVGRTPVALDDGERDARIARLRNALAR